MRKAKQAIEHLLFRSDVSSYQISKDTGIGKMVISKYRNGKSDLENMTFGNAIKLHDYYLKLKEDSKMPSAERDMLFGKILAVSNVISERVFERNKPSVASDYLQRFQRKPASTWTKIHEELMNYVHSFGKKENELLDMFDGIIAEMNEDIFNDDPLSDKFLLGFYKEQERLKKYRKYYKEEVKMKKISIDNGMTFVTPKEAIERIEFEEIVSWMDADTREKVHSMEFDSDLEFLEKYLKLAEKDLIIG